MRSVDRRISDSLKVIDSSGPIASELETITNTGESGPHACTGAMYQRRVLPVAFMSTLTAVSVSRSGSGSMVARL